MKKLLTVLTLMLILCFVFISCTNVSNGNDTDTQTGAITGGGNNLGNDNDITESEAIISAYNAFSKEYSDVEANSVIVEVLNGSNRLKTEASRVWYICFHKITVEYERSYIDYLYLVSKNNGKVTASITPENTSNYINYNLEMTNCVERGVNSVYNDNSPITVDDRIDGCCAIKFNLAVVGEYWEFSYSQFCMQDYECAKSEREEFLILKDLDTYEDLKSAQLTINGDIVQFYTMGTDGLQEVGFGYTKESFTTIIYQSNETSFKVVFEFKKAIPEKVEIADIYKFDSLGNRGGVNTLITKETHNGNKFEFEFSIEEPNYTDIYAVKIKLYYSSFYDITEARADFAIRIE